MIFAFGGSSLGGYADTGTVRCTQLSAGWVNDMASAWSTCGLTVFAISAHSPYDVASGVVAGAVVTVLARVVVRHRPDALVRQIPGSRLWPLAAP
ncbi:hypothetical protein ABZ454_36610 [Streptomyces sp. NPDC005803]|uniref:hypothetical protein n=1 Tax=Streptomyces sp. NPDC005803 TaxID=3154297 RepID=UPI0033CD3659